MPKKAKAHLIGGTYSNPAVDKALELPTSEFDVAKREAILRDSAQLVSDDVAIFPLFHYKNIWATKKGFKVTPMTSDRTAAQMVSKVAK